MITPTPLPRTFYTRPTVDLARDLLGKLLIHSTPDGITSGIIVEAEAYCHTERACHTYKGMTPRTRVLFGPPGHTYIFSVHGHICFNLSAAEEGVGETVLIRAIEPVNGVEIMMRRRRVKDARQLTNGPGKLAQAMGIDKRYYGHDLHDTPLCIADGIDVCDVARGRRIGVDYADDDAELPWRFWIRGNKYVSRRG